MTTHKVTEGVKHDAGKPRMDLLPFDALLSIADVLAFGAEEYGERNWENGMAWGRVFGALGRHLAAYWLGEDRDPKSNKLHLAHAACCILFLLAYQIRGAGTDDRFKG
jgi:hypothetical protein